MYHPETVHTNIAQVILSHLCLLFLFISFLCLHSLSFLFIYFLSLSQVFVNTFSYFQMSQLTKRCHHLFKDATLFGGGGGGGGVGDLAVLEKENNNVKQS